MPPYNYKHNDAAQDRIGEAYGYSTHSHDLAHSQPNMQHHRRGIAKQAQFRKRRRSTFDRKHTKFPRRNAAIEENPFALPRYRIQRARRFVNRDSELRYIGQQLELLKKGGEVQECIINFYAVPGMGKSALLAKLSDTWVDDKQLVLIELDLALVFRGAFTQAPRSRFLQAFEEWVNPPKTEARDYFFDRLRSIHENSSEDELNEALSALATYLIDLQKPVFLIIDSWERVGRAILMWIERLLLLPLVKTNRLFVVFGNQTILGWSEFEVRRRAKSVQLGPLEVTHTQKQINCPPEEAVLIQRRMTFGYPLANELINDELEQTRQPNNLLQLHQARLVQEIVDHMYQRTIEEMSSELYRIVTVMTLFREFHIGTLRVILPQFYAEFQTRSQSSLLLSIKELLGTRFVDWNNEVKAYQFNPTIRSICMRALELNDPEQYIAIREAALTYYERVIADTPANRVIYIVEYCYHTLYKYPNDSYNGVSSVTAALEAYLTQYYQNPDGTILAVESLDLLRSAFRDDEEIRHALVAQHASANLLSDLVGRFMQ